MRHDIDLIVEPCVSTVLPLWQHPAVCLSVHCLWPECSCQEVDWPLTLQGVELGVRVWNLDLYLGRNPELGDELVCCLLYHQPGSQQLLASRIARCADPNMCTTDIESNRMQLLRRLCHHQRWRQCVKGPSSLKSFAERATRNFQD